MALTTSKYPVLVRAMPLLRLTAFRYGVCVRAFDAASRLLVEFGKAHAHEPTTSLVSLKETDCSVLIWVHGERSFEAAGEIMRVLGGLTSGASAVLVTG